MTRCRLLLTCVLIGASTGPVEADAVDDLIAALKPSSADNALWAAKLLKAVKDLETNPSGQVRLCEKAYECGMKAPAGYASALAALDLLEKLAPRRAETWRQKRLEIHRQKYLVSPRANKIANGTAYITLLLDQAGRCGKDNNWRDAAVFYRQTHQVARTLRLPEARAIYDKVRLAGARAVLHDRVAALARAVENNGGDLRSRKQLITAYLVDLDMPAKAAEVLNDQIDPTLRANISKAAKPASELTDKDFLTLATWYRSLADGATAKDAKVRMLLRARTNLKRYLEVYTAQDAHRLTVKALATKVDGRLKLLGPSPADTGARTLTLELAKGVTMALVPIPAGTFVMGSPNLEPGRRADEGKQRTVTISTPFHMGIMEVTRGQFAVFVADTGYKTQAEKLGFAHRIRFGQYSGEKLKGAYWRKCGFPQTDSHPVVAVDWGDAMVFCRWLSRRSKRHVTLPTEAQWEYACRAGTKTPYHWGLSSNAGRGWCNGFDQAARQRYPKKPKGAAFRWSDDCVYTAPVGRFRPNAFGLHDMHGNVAEWCRDCYAEGFYATAAATDPENAIGGKHRVLRGGGWSHFPVDCRSAARLHDKPDMRNCGYGFRVVVLPAQAKPAGK